MVERWKPVVDYEDLYQVSDRGRIRRIAGGPGACAGRILRQRNDGGGYPHVHLYWNGHQKTRKVHRLVAEAFLGPRPDGLEVNHKNGIKEDNRVTELEYITRGKNLEHSYRVLGREPSRVRGEANGQAKLTTAKVKQIRRRYAKGGISQQALAEQYDVSPMTINLTLRRKRWAHVA